MLTDAVLERISVRSDGCWGWTGAVHSDGYSVYGDQKVHRLTYLALVDDVPAGLELDHLCRNRWCVNPLHLEAVTHRENVLRGNSPSARHARQTHCGLGHLLPPPGADGKRTCLTCQKRRNGLMQVRRAIKELAAAGLIADTGRRRVNSSGNMATVWYAPFTGEIVAGPQPCGCTEDAACEGCAG